ncbi:MAG: sulfatase-like hydrolase/transferase [Verrucomicrobiales bacterium]|nr:sulfatase-like hydrolase/transferase [Verrucomicrobiales bacterium]
MRIALFLSAVFLISLATPGDAAKPLRPNILYFYVDDMGWGAVGPNGQAERRAKGLPTVQTPNLDQLAAEGVNFTRAYGATVCSPARSAQQIGFHQGHAFADRNDPDNAKKAMRADDVTMGDALSAAGYETGYWGKWGYGGTKDQVNPEIVNVQTLPTSHGYRHVLTELHHVRAHTFFQPTLWSAPAAPGAKGAIELVPNSLSGRTNPDLFPDRFTKHRDPRYPEPAYCDDAYCFAALEFVRRQAENYRETGDPFFGLLAVQIPHAPFDEIATLPGWDEAYEDDPHFKNLAAQSRQWAAMVTRIDAHFGVILAALDDPDGDGDHSDSISDNTLVIFMSDNGGPKGPNNAELDANGGLRGNKGSIFEGGIRVPTIMRWPDRIKTDSEGLRAGTNCDEVIDVTDLLPTFCELAGVTAPVGLDGVSIAPLLAGEDADDRRRRDFLIHEAGKSASIIRGRHKLIRTGGKKVELYDLAVDPAESKDIAASEPELAKELEALLLGERVTEPRGFANTYHRWIGETGASANDAGNWSDYVYENEGITYLTDDGPPRLSWTARMRNEGESPNVARSDADLSFLGFEIGGGESAPEATQELALGSKVTLTGRNEIRVSSGGILTLNKSVLSSLRWIDVLEGGVLRGKGKIDAELRNAGNVSVKAGSSSGSAGLVLGKNFHQEKQGRLCFAFSGNAAAAAASMEVSGIARLGGTVHVEWENGAVPRVGAKIPLLRAEQVAGRFVNSDDQIFTPDGVILRILYGRNGVDAVVVAVSAVSSS